MQTKVDLDALVTDVGDSEKAVREAQANRLLAIYALHRALPTDRSSAAMDAIRAEVATLLNISMRSATRLYDDAFLTCTRDPLITALKEGLLDLSRAKLIATLLPTTDDQERFEAAAIAYGATHTAHELRKWLLSRLPDSGDDTARKTAFDKRYIEVIPDRDGMSDLHGYLPTELAEAFFSTIDKLARDNKTPDDDRSLDQRRADAVADLLDERTEVTTTVNVVLPASGKGASVNGSPLPWSAAWHLACRTDPTWFGWLGAPDGRIINSTPGRYRISPALARTVRARDQHCRFPGCGEPAARCDLDHLVAFPLGATTDDNLHCLCRRHHRIKHQTDWTVTNLGHNELEWTSPAGRSYRTKPPDAFDYAA